MNNQWKTTNERVKHQENTAISLAKTWTTTYLPQVVRFSWSPICFLLFRNVFVVQNHKNENRKLWKTIKYSEQLMNNNKRVCKKPRKWCSVAIKNMNNNLFATGRGKFGLPRGVASKVFFILSYAFQLFFICFSLLYIVFQEFSILYSYLS